MDTVQVHNVKIPNSLLVSGMTDTKTDEELFDFLKQYGQIERMIPIDDAQLGPGKSAIVEYTYGTAVESISPSLPYSLSSKTQSSVVFHIKSLTSCYVRNVGVMTRKTFLEELKKIAKESGKDFASVLRDELSRISAVVETDDLENEIELESYLPNDPASHAVETADRTSPQLSSVLMPNNLFDHNQSKPLLTPWSQTKPVLSPHDVNPPELQKDSELSDLYKSRRLLDSLTSPAIDIVKHLPSDSSPDLYLEILDSAYSTVENGDDLYVKFLNTFQDQGEKPSAYLQRLQVMLNTTLRRGGVTASDVHRQLLKQFCRGCWDNDLISELQLEKRSHNPPTLAKLLLLLRTEEDKQASKICRMKQHFGVYKQKVYSELQCAYVQDAEACSKPSAPSLRADSNAEIQGLVQVADLQSQLTRLIQKNNGKSQKKSLPKQDADKPLAQPSKTQKAQPADSTVVTQSNRPRPWYCFRCGEDGHIKPQCSKDPNPSLIAAKRNQLKEKQLAWDTLDLN
ncbi:hypothetical protein SRHO_G00270660 [Serrasalmus rhombeus]